MESYQVSQKHKLQPVLPPALPTPLAFIPMCLDISALMSVSLLLPGPAENKCQELLCTCDKELAYCLEGTEYHLKYLFYPSVLCEKNSPKCD